MERQMLDAMNAFYSEIVDRVDNGSPASRDHGPVLDKKHKHAIPLPATFTIDAGERISKTESGMQVRLYSRYPWPTRRTAGRRTSSSSRPSSGWSGTPTCRSRSSREIDGRRSLIYATARKMEKSCLECHNSKTSQQPQEGLEGRGRGRRAQDRASAGPRHRPHARRACAGAFVLMGSVSTLLVAACVWRLVHHATAPETAAQA